MSSSWWRCFSASWVGGRWMLWQVAASTACWVGLVSESVCYASKKFYWGLCFAASWANSKIAGLRFKKWIMIFLESIIPSSLTCLQLFENLNHLPFLLWFLYVECRWKTRKRVTIGTPQKLTYIYTPTPWCFAFDFLSFCILSKVGHFVQISKPQVLGEEKSPPRIRTPPVCPNLLRFGLWLVCFFDWYVFFGSNTVQ